MSLDPNLVLNKIPLSVLRSFEAAGRSGPFGNWRNDGLLHHWPELHGTSLTWAITSSTPARQGSPMIEIFLAWLLQELASV